MAAGREAHELGELRRGETVKRVRMLVGQQILVILREPGGQHADRNHR